jgi:hypothetical protein
MPSVLLTRSIKQNGEWAGRPLSSLTGLSAYVIQPTPVSPSLPTVQGKRMTKNSKAFDIIVLAGMVVNILLAVFLILYYFDFL